MIKFLAAILMLIDHVGAIILPDTIFLRIVGRLSMPMFAFPLARAFRNAGQGSVTDFKPYLFRLLGFATVSQVPFYFAFSGLNIGVTWVLSFFVLCVVSHYKNIDKRISWALILAICFFSVAFPVGYGLSGVAYPVLFYLCYYKFGKPQYVFVGSAFLFAVSVAVDGLGLIQGFSIMAIPLVEYLSKRDNYKILPRWFYYVFYPAHLTLLLLVKMLFFY